MVFSQEFLTLFQQEEFPMRKTILLLAVIGLAGSLWAADPTMGTWKLNIAKSKLPPTSANIKDTVMVFREIDANTFEGVSTETLKDGKTNTMKWTTPNSGGIQTYQQGGPPKNVSTVAVKVDAHTIYNVYLQDGKQVGLFRVTFGKDFKTFTMSGTTRDAQGKPVEYLALYEK
jgi:hypothetical protein